MCVDGRPRSSYPLSRLTRALGRNTPGVSRRRRRVLQLARRAWHRARRGRRAGVRRVRIPSRRRTTGPPTEQARPRDDLAQARRGARLPSPLARSSPRARCPRRPPARPPPARADARRRPRQRAPGARRRGADRAAQPRARRARLLGRATKRRGRRPRPRRRRLRAGARARPSRKRRQGARRAARRGGSSLGVALPARARPALAAGANDALFLSVRGRRLDTSTLRRVRRTRTASDTPSPRTCSRAARTSVRSRSCSVTARCRRRRSTATSTPGGCARSTTAPTRALNVARAKRALAGVRTPGPNAESRWTPPSSHSSRSSPRGSHRGPSTPTGAISPTSAGWLGGPPDAVTTDRSRGTSRRCAPPVSRRRRSPAASPRFAPSTGTRCCSALATTIRPPSSSSPSQAHAAAHALARRGRAAGRSRIGRNAALAPRPRPRRVLYGAGLRVSEAVGLERNGVDLEQRVVRCIGKGSKERIVPVGREAVEALRRYLSRGRPYLDVRHRPELFLNARGGGLTRAGAFLILRRLAETAGSSPAESTPTCCAIRSPRICSRAAPICARFRRCSATRIWPRPSSTPTYPIDAAGSCIPERTPTLGKILICRSRTRCTDDRSAHCDACRRHVASGWLMAHAGLRKGALERRRRRRSCPSCGRHLDARVCAHCSAGRPTSWLAASACA